ncbi:MAG: tRNA (adenosine(37)-N6)-threonylcarbamoyltransferase complex transferase subunit TsaD [bacterium]|nr:tRNA (adenosine(37)-N6)-threonylcarbamoyltransferase complex transferase subunit TsaD [bacterium]
MKILGIESTCDETAAAVVSFEPSQISQYSSPQIDLLSSVVHSQIDIHAQFGGVIPEVAARSHIEYINPVIRKALAQAGETFESIDGIAVSFAPGLNGSLLVGNLAARTYAQIFKKKFFPVHHVEAHVYANFLNQNPPQFPFLALVVSGGHSQIVLFRGHSDFEILGETQDDAVGEAFDKVAKILGLPYPGGPAISKAAQNGDPSKYHFPKARLAGEFDFSFSGVKTAVLRAVQKEVGVDFNFPSFELAAKLNEQQKCDFAASFQQTAVETLVDKLEKAVQKFQPKTVVIAGGVAANLALREELLHRISRQVPDEIIFTEPQFCTDNAAMVAALGAFHFALGEPQNPLDAEVKPSLSMENAKWLHKK